MAEKLKIIPLGGLNEIGKNMTAYEYGGEIIVVDCGMAFPGDDMYGIDLIIPDVSYLIKNRARIRGLFITHGHEDHVGAIPYVLKQLNMPIYCTRFTAGLIKLKLEEHGLVKSTKLITVEPGKSVRAGKFTVEFIHVNHSIADSVAFAIHTHMGTIVHTGDFKIDSTPIDGEVIDLARFGELGKEGVLALLADSTNVERPGFTPSEKTVGATFKRQFQGCEDRIIVTTFASNVHRIQQVLDAAAAPAAGASGLPAGLIAPHVSPDDAPLSRLSRAGVRATLQRAHALLDHGKDWAPTGVLEHRVEGKRALPLAADDETALWMADWTAPADIQRTVPSALPPQAQALWHACGAWIRPARLVRMQLSHPGIRWRGGCPVRTAERTAAGWRLLDANGSPLAEADVLILACAYATRALLAQVTGAEATLPAHPLHGQVSWGPMSAVPAAANCLLPPWPVNGHGSFLHGIPGDGGQPFWILGSTFDRGQTQPTVSPEGHRANLARLQRLLPALGEAMAPAIEQAQGWAAVRCTLPDRMPAIGAIDPGRWSGLYVFTGLGARGLTLSVLGGECLAAQLHGEPWPVEPALAKALQASRFMR